MVCFDKIIHCVCWMISFSSECCGELWDRLLPRYCDSHMQMACVRAER